MIFTLRLVFRYDCYLFFSAFSKAIFNFRTLTFSGPNKPNNGPSVLAFTRAMTLSGERPRACATRCTLSLIHI